MAQTLCADSMQGPLRLNQQCNQHQPVPCICTLLFDGAIDLRLGYAQRDAMLPADDTAHRDNGLGVLATEKAKMADEEASTRAGGADRSYGRGKRDPDASVASGRSWGEESMPSMRDDVGQGAAVQDPDLDPDCNNHRGAEFRPTHDSLLTARSSILSTARNELPEKRHTVQRRYHVQQ